MLQCVHNELNDSGSYNEEKANDDQKEESLIKCLIKKTNLINELTSSRVYAHTLFIKLNPAPITFYVAPNQCDYWETLNVCSPKKNERICNILIFQNIFETYIHSNIH